MSPRASGTRSPTRTPPSSRGWASASPRPTAISTSYARCSSRCARARTRPAPPPSSDDPAPDRVDRRLDAVVDLQLHEDVRDVVLDRLRADVQLARDLSVVLAVRDQLQDFDLAVGELRPDRLLGIG